METITCSFSAGKKELSNTASQILTSKQIITLLNIPGCLLSSNTPYQCRVMITPEQTIAVLCGEPDDRGLGYYIIDLLFDGTFVLHHGAPAQEVYYCILDGVGNLTQIALPNLTHNHQATLAWAAKISNLRSRHWAHMTNFYMS